MWPWCPSLMWPWCPSLMWPWCPSLKWPVLNAKKKIVRDGKLFFSPSVKKNFTCVNISTGLYETCPRKWHILGYITLAATPLTLVYINEVRSPIFISDAEYFMSI